MSRALRLPALSVLAAAAHLAIVSSAWGGPPSPPADGQARIEAAARFAEGRRAFDRGDYRHAAEEFEAAEQLAPHIDVLWNAARAWARAGELPRAATLYSRYLRESSGDAPDRNVAQAELSALATKLGRIDVHGDHVDQLAIDGQPIDERIVYVSPGAHVIVANVNGRRSTQTVSVATGSVVGVAFADDASVTAPPPRPQPPRRTEVATTPRPSTGWSPWIVVGGGALTAAATGFTVWSGLQTLDALNAFDSHPTPTNLSRGQSDQTRTNLLLGVSVALAALTAATAIWLVDWRAAGGAEVRAGLGPAGADAQWRF
jgi:hypothetical protein